MLIDYDDCPLARWLNKNHQSVKDFAQRIDMPWGTLYRILHAEKRQYSADTLRRIEVGTGGEVTMRGLMDWLDERWRSHGGRGKRAGLAGS